MQPELGAGGCLGLHRCRYPSSEAVHSQPSQRPAREGPFREAVKSLFLFLATLHGDGKGEVSSSYPR